VSTGHEFVRTGNGRLFRQLLMISLSDANEKKRLVPAIRKAKSAIQRATVQSSRIGSLPRL
jgi:hypothetical protein